MSDDKHNPQINNIRKVANALSAVMEISYEDAVRHVRQMFINIELERKGL